MNTSLSSKGLRSVKMWDSCEIEPVISLGNDLLLKDPLGWPTPAVLGDSGPLAIPLLRSTVGQSKCIDSPVGRWNRWSYCVCRSPGSFPGMRSGYGIEKSKRLSGLTWLCKYMGHMMRNLGLQKGSRLEAANTNEASYPQKEGEC